MGIFTRETNKLNSSTPLQQQQQQQTIEEEEAENMAN